MIVSWFSAGVSSAVATKLLIEKIDKIIYIDIADHHPDNIRFVDECSAWFGKPIEILKSPYESVESACFGSGGRGYVNGPAGAACTKFLKRRVRKDWERGCCEKLTYVWGMDLSEQHRCDRLVDSMPKQGHLFPLVDEKISKVAAHKILNASGIRRPAMYDLGYSNNNCIGCVKGGKGYWNHIRNDFPDVFKSRAAMERKIEATCIKDTYLDELDPLSGRHEPKIVDDCGIFCELMAIE